MQGYISKYPLLTFLWALTIYFPTWKISLYIILQGIEKGLSL
ncbi:rCG57701 [Rattus norvegicus]|uniref:RCG57701 n=1 Tax=Rattus norvegicus TaxID=10116 RepID=A6JH70_RAT|nr:rCG57701 [Rattus norvegicus]